MRQDEPETLTTPDAPPAEGAGRGADEDAPAAEPAGDALVAMLQSVRRRLEVEEWPELLAAVAVALTELRERPLDRPHPQLEGSPLRPVASQLPVLQEPTLPPNTGLSLTHQLVKVGVVAHLGDTREAAAMRYRNLLTWLDGLHACVPAPYYRDALLYLRDLKRVCYRHVPPELQDYRVDREELLSRTHPVTNPLLRLIRFLWARFHVLVRCNFCPPQDRRSHDMACEGDCWFRRRWDAGLLDTPFWMGWSEHRRLQRIRRARRRRGLPLLEPPAPPMPPRVKGHSTAEAVQPGPRPTRRDLRLWTIPNVLTLTRVALLPGVIVAIRLNSGLGYFIAFVLASLGEITDFTDGHVARVRGETSALGKLLDPMADTLTRFSIFLTLHSVGLVPLWMILVLFARDMSIAYLRAFAASSGVIIGARTSGKVKAVFQGLFTLLILAMMMAGRYHTEVDTTGAQLTWVGLMLGAMALPSIFTWLFKIRGGLLWLIRGCVVSATAVMVLARFGILPRFDPELPVWLLMLVVTLVTAYSLGDYLLAFVRVVNADDQDAAG